MTARDAARLVVMRHAKSAWPDVADHERPLAPRGRRDAPAAGRWLRASGHVPDLVLSSTARRARATWDLVAAELGAAPPVVFEPRIYAADGTALMDLVRETPRERRTVLLIGHQPAVQDVVLALAGDAEGDALERASEKFPTSAIAVLALPGGTWAELAPGGGVLTAYAVPRGRKDKKDKKDKRD